MKVIDTKIPDVKIIEPTVFGDERGFFMETWNQKRFEELVTGKPTQFVQDNHSKSKKGILRGLHYQTENTQGKLVRVVYGEVFDVAVDIRKTHLHLVNGLASIYLLITNGSYGFLKVLHMDFMLRRKVLSLSTNVQITTVQNMRIQLYGMIKIWPYHGL